MERYLHSKFELYEMIKDVMINNAMSLHYVTINNASRGGHGSVREKTNNVMSCH